MDADFWHARWQRNEIGFHQATPHPLLARGWPAPGLAPASRVFVPLAGKSLDLLAIAQAGQRVVGIELSQIAVEAFFAEHGLAPRIEAIGELRRYAVPDLELWCGDFFTLDAAQLGHIDAVFDRGALVALPADMRRRYATQLTSLCPVGCQMLLVTTEYDPAQMAGPPHAVLAAEVEALYGAHWALRRLGREVPADAARFAQRGAAPFHEGHWLLQRHA